MLHGLSRPDNGSAALDVAAGDWQEAIDCRSAVHGAATPSSTWMAAAVGRVEVGGGRGSDAVRMTKRLLRRVA